MVPLTDSVCLLSHTSVINRRLRRRRRQRPNRQGGKGSHDRRSYSPDDMSVSSSLMPALAQLHIHAGTGGERRVHGARAQVYGTPDERHSDGTCRVLMASAR